MTQESSNTATLEPEAEQRDDIMRGADAPDSAEQGGDETEKLRNAMQAKVMEVRMRLEHVKSYAASQGLPPPQVQDAEYLDQDPSTLSAADLADLEARMQNIDRDVTSHEAGQVQQETGKAVGALAGLALLGGGAAEGLLASLGVTGGNNVPEAQLFNGVDHGIGAIGLQQQKGGPNMVDM